MLLSVLADRTRKYIRGSADDIGWLQRDPFMPPVTDGTQSFTEILDNIRFLESTNYPSPWFICSFQSSVEKNAKDLKHQIEEISRQFDKRVMLLGHSKGGLDAAAALSMYWFDLKDKVAGLALPQSPYGGTPIASDLARQGQLGDLFLKAMVSLVCNIIKGDVRALEDLTYEKRREFLKKHSLPKEIPVVSFHTEADTSLAALATWTRIANFEPYLTGKHEVIVATGGLMAATALGVQNRYGEKSDGLVTRCDAEVPGSVVVRPKRKLDHQWLVFPSVHDSPYEANSAQMCEALLQLVMEIGQTKNRHFG